jgi:isopentenyl-diphosphate delta-isomerase
MMDRMSDTEMIDVLDADGNVIRTITREEAERDNHLTENVLVFLFNASGEVWTQLRPQTKNHFPGRWDISACGGVVSGETPAQAAVREVLEETGLNPTLHYAETFLNVFPGDNGEERKRLSHLFVGVSDETPRINEEVDEFKAWQPDELRADIAANPNSYIPSFLVELDKALAAHAELPR